MIRKFLVAAEWQGISGMSGILALILSFYVFTVEQRDRNQSQTVPPVVALRTVTTPTPQTVRFDPTSPPATMKPSQAAPPSSAASNRTAQTDLAIKQQLIGAGLGIAHVTFVGSALWILGMGLLCFKLEGRVAFMQSLTWTVIGGGMFLLWLFAR